MAGHLETATLGLTLRSPLHIGTRVRQYSPLEAVAFGGHVYKISEDRLALALRDAHALDAFVARVRRDGAGFDLGRFLEEQNRLTAPFLGSIAEFRSRAPSGIPPQVLATFRPHMRGGLGRVYLPGSSLKGALRTALLNGVLRAKDTPWLERHLDRPVTEQLDRRAKREWFAQRITGDLLQGELDFGPGRPAPRNLQGPNREFLRAVKIADAHYEGETVIHPVKVLSLRRGDGEFYLKEQMLLECIPAGAVLQVQVTVDQGILSSFRGGRPFGGIDDLLESALAFSAEVREKEQSFFEGLSGGLSGFYEGLRANLRVGFGSGLHATTIHFRLPEGLNTRIRDEVFRAKRESGYFPKSRRVVCEGDRPVAPLGWVEVERG